MARTPKVEVERPPEDALPDVKLPRQTAILVGHAAAEQTLLEAYRSGRMHHAWLIAGAPGIGRATLAFRFARFVLAHPDQGAAELLAATDLSVPEADPAAHRIAAGVHPNLLHLQREWNPKSDRYRASISVDATRRIIHFLGTTAGVSGSWRIVIADPLDDMTPNAANALLKNLEEPPTRTLFLLVCRSRGSVLPTIASRCRMLQLEPLGEADTVRVAETVWAPAGEAPERVLAAHLANGSPRRLIAILQGDGVSIYREMLKAIERDDGAARLALAGRAAASERACDAFLDIFDGYLHRRVHGLAEPDRAAAPPIRPLVTWAVLWEKAAAAAREVRTLNLDRTQFVLDLLERSAAAMRETATPSLQ